MSAIAFIRRPTACDILVHFNRSDYPNHRSAWGFCQTWLRRASNAPCPEADVPYAARACSDQVVASIPAGTAFCYQRTDGFPDAPYSATSHVNPRGTVSLTEEEALRLGATGEPENFVPYNSKNILSYDVPPTEDTGAELYQYAEDDHVPAPPDSDDEEERDPAPIQQMPIRPTRRSR